MAKKDLVELVEKTAVFASGLVSGASVFYAANNFTPFEANSYGLLIGCGATIAVMEYLETKYNDKKPVTKAVRNGLERSVGLILAGAYVLHHTN